LCSALNAPSFNSTATNRFKTRKGELDKARKQLRIAFGRPPG